MESLKVFTCVCKSGSLPKNVHYVRQMSQNLVKLAQWSPFAKAGNKGTHNLWSVGKYGFIFSGMWNFESLLATFCSFQRLCLFSRALSLEVVEKRPNVYSFWHPIFIGIDNPIFYNSLLARFTAYCLAKFDWVPFANLCTTSSNEAECSTYERWVTRHSYFKPFVDQSLWNFRTL